jgi:hypothetical protein
MTSPGVKLTPLACHQTKRVNKSEEPTYLSTNIGYNPSIRQLLYVFRFFKLAKHASLLRESRCFFQFGQEGFRQQKLPFDVKIRKMDEKTMKFERN